MTDILASLIQSPQGGPPDLQAGRARQSRELPGRKDSADDANIETARKPERSQPKERATQKASEDPASAGAHVANATNRTQTLPDRARSADGDFRKVFQDRLNSLRSRRTAEGDKTPAKAKSEPEARPLFAALSDLLGENVLAILPGRSASVPDGRQNASSRQKPATGAQTPAKKPDTKAAPQDAKLPPEKVSPDKVADANAPVVKKATSAPMKATQPEPPAEKPAASDKNTKISTARAEVAEQTKEVRLGAEQKPIAPHGRADEKTGVVQIQDPPAHAAKAGEPLLSVKLGKMAQGGQPSDEEPAPKHIIKDAKSLTAGMERTAAKNAIPEESDVASAIAGKQGGAANAPDTSAQIAQFLKTPQHIEKLEVTDRPQAAAAATAAQTLGKPNAFTAPTESPAEQIIQSIRLNARGPQQEIDIRLNPTELGAVRMRFQHADGELTGTLFLDKAQTRYEIEKELPQIIASLQHNGVQVRRLDVVMNQQHNQQNDAHNPHGDAFAEAEQGGFGRKYGSHDPDSPGALDQLDENQTETAAGQTRESHITDEAISVYV